MQKRCVFAIKTKVSRVAEMIRCCHTNFIYIYMYVYIYILCLFNLIYTYICTVYSMYVCIYRKNSFKLHWQNETDQHMERKDPLGSAENKTCMKHTMPCSGSEVSHSEEMRIVEFEINLSGFNMTVE